MPIRTIQTPAVLVSWDNNKHHQVFAATPFVKGGTIRAVSWMSSLYAQTYGWGAFIKHGQTLIPFVVHYKEASTIGVNMWTWTGISKPGDAATTTHLVVAEPVCQVAVVPGDELVIVIGEIAGNNIDFGNTIIGYSIEEDATP